MQAQLLASIGAISLLSAGAYADEGRDNNSGEFNLRGLQQDSHDNNEQDDLNTEILIPYNNVSPATIVYEMAPYQFAANITIEYPDDSTYYAIPYAGYFIEFRNYTSPFLWAMFDDHLAPSEPDYQSSSTVRLLQIEQYDKTAFEISDNGGIEFTKNHCQAAANIQEWTAQTVTNVNFESICLGVPLTNHIRDQEYERLLMGADIVTLSYVPYFERDEQGWRETPSSTNQFMLQHPVTRSYLSDFWDQADTITVQAAGNDDFADSDTLYRSHEYIVNWNDNYLSVGIAKANDETGDVYIERYSSASAPSVVTLNPFDLNYQFQYYPSVEDVNRAIPTIFKNNEAIGQLTACGEFESDLEDETSYGAAFEEATDCVLSTLDELTDNPIENINGTSFAAPHLSGMIASAMEAVEQNYGEDILSPHDYWAATMISALPVQQAMLGDDTMTDLTYQDMGAGLHYNFNIAGFGLVSAENLIQTALVMAEAVHSGEANSTISNLIYNYGLNYEGLIDEEEQTIREYSFDVQSEEQLGRMMFVFDFDYTSDYEPFKNLNTGEEENTILARPERIELISPDGVVLPLSPSMEREDNLYSVAATNGFLGVEAQGTWRVRIPDAYVISGFEGRMISYGDNSAVSHVIEHYYGREAAQFANTGNAPAITFNYEQTEMPAIPRAFSRPLLPMPR